MQQPRVVAPQAGELFPFWKWIAANGLVVEPSAHHFVIANERVDRPADLSRPALEIEDEVQNLALIVAAADEIAQLDDGQRAANPLVASVNRTGRAQSKPQGTDIGVNVADGDDTSTAG